MHPPLVDQAGMPVDTDAPERASVSARRLFFDWSSVVAIVIAAMTYATLAGQVKTNTRELERIRAYEEQQRTDDIRIAETMATRADVRRVEDLVQALSLELRNARAAK